jgi:hypothetical protein
MIASKKGAIMKKIFTLAAISSGLLFANSINYALTHGKTKAKLSFYFENYNFKNKKDSGYGMYSLLLKYSTKKFDSFKINVGLQANEEIYEKYPNDFNDPTKAVLNVLNLTYKNSNFSFVVGRKKEKYQWIHGYQQEAKAIFYPIKGCSFTILHTFKHSRDNIKDPIKPFKDINGKHGLNMVQIDEKTSGFDAKAFFYDAPSLANWFGMKINSKYFDATYSQSDEKTDKPDGKYLDLEGKYSINPLSVKIGYLQTGKDGGLGSMTIARDVYNSLNPLEEGFEVFEKDAKTLYGSVKYAFNEKLNFVFKYGHIKFENQKAREEDLYLNYKPAKNLKVSLCADSYRSDVSLYDENALKGQIIYSF